jgi:hypothetical protein
MERLEIKHKDPEPTKEPERKDSVHRALHLLLHHAAVSQPEIAKEAKVLQGELDDRFMKAQPNPTRGRGAQAPPPSNDEPPQGDKT